MKLRAGVYLVEVDYGTALLDEECGEYWNLNPTGALILEKLLAGGTAEDAARALAEEYAVDLGSAERDVGELVDELCSAGLVKP